MSWASSARMHVVEDTATNQSQPATLRKLKTPVDRSAGVLYCNLESAITRRLPSELPRGLPRPRTTAGRLPYSLLPALLDVASGSPSRRWRSSAGSPPSAPRTINAFHAFMAHALELGKLLVVDPLPSLLGHGGVAVGVHHHHHHHDVSGADFHGDERKRAQGGRGEGSRAAPSAPTGRLGTGKPEKVGAPLAHRMDAK